MQISNSIYYFTSLEVSWLVHVADWEWPLRNYINYLLTDVSCWSQVIDPCLPFLKFYDYCVKGSLCVRAGTVGDGATCNVVSRWLGPHTE